MYQRRWRRLASLLLLVALSAGCGEWEECSRFTSDDARWAADDVSPDLRHLGVTASTEPFAFRASDLQRLCELNHLNLAEGQDEVLFGLRGCGVVDARESLFSESVQLRESTPDHVGYRDVLGVWQQSTAKIAVFQGSTVPNWEFMCQQAELGGHRANMLPTGRYIYYVGKHGDTVGAFRLEAEVIVLRSNDDLVYETTDDWEAWVPQDNIHPGGCPGEMFSSAGCQTVMGTFGKKCEGLPGGGVDTHSGPWAAFRQSAGLDPGNNQDRWRAPYVYVLLTCREARLAGGEADLESLSRLRFGSGGTAVEALQTKLVGLGYSDVPTDGLMGPQTTMAYVRWQQSQNDGAADGIVTPATAETLGFTLEQ